MPSPDGCDDFVWISEPLEGFGIGVVVIEEAVDSGLKIDDGTEDAALQTALTQCGEEAFDRIEPRGRSRREAERPARMTRQP